MPFRTCGAHDVPATGPLDFLLSTHHRNAEASLDDCYITAFSLAAERHQHLFNLIRKDPTIANQAFPFWPPLFSLTQLADVAVELGGDGEKQLDCFNRGQVFSAAAGMDPSLPWDDWYDDLTQHDFDNAPGEKLVNDERYA
eukprot:1568718-Rhodomonas_salina.1